jgi:hypothetical protein
MARYSLPECNCGSGLEAPQHLDGHGIFLTYACDKCWPEKKRRYRPDIDQRYECDEPIEAEDY